MKELWNSGEEVASIDILSGGRRAIFTIMTIQTRTQVDFSPIPSAEILQLLNELIFKRLINTLPEGTETQENKSLTCVFVLLTTKPFVILLCVLCASRACGLLPVRS